MPLTKLENRKYASLTSNKEIFKFSASAEMLVGHDKGAVL